MRIKRILLIDGSAGKARSLVDHLEAFYKIQWVQSLESGVKLIETESPDLLLISLRSPGIDGMATCRHIRQQKKGESLPIILILDEADDVDQVVGLEMGADDCIVRSTTAHVFHARIRAILRRSKKRYTKVNGPINLPDLHIDPSLHSIVAGNKSISLTNTEFALLATLAGQPGHVFSRQRLLERARGKETTITSRTVDVHILSLRRKLGNIGMRIKTVRGTGYRYSE